MSTGKIILILIIVAGVISLLIGISSSNNEDSFVGESRQGQDGGFVTIDGVPETAFRGDCLGAGYFFEEMEEPNNCYIFDSEGVGNAEFELFCASSGGTITAVSERDRNYIRCF